MPLRILNTKVDGTNGHISHVVRMETEVSPGNTILGPEETIGIWPRALMSRHHPVDVAPCQESVQCAHRAWLQSCHRDIKRRHEDLLLMHQAANSMKPGELIDIDEDDDGGDGENSIAQG